MVLVGACAMADEEVEVDEVDENAWRLTGIDETPVRAPIVDSVGSVQRLNICLQAPAFCRHSVVYQQSTVSSRVGRDATATEHCIKQMDAFTLNLRLCGLLLSSAAGLGIQNWTPSYTPNTVHIHAVSSSNSSLLDFAQPVYYCGY